jgi:hypothetical protein
MQWLSRKKNPKNSIFLVVLGISFGEGDKVKACVCLGINLRTEVPSLFNLSLES